MKLNEEIFFGVRSMLRLHESEVIYLSCQVRFDSGLKMMNITSGTKLMKKFDVVEIKMIIECKKNTKMVKPTLFLNELRVIYL